MNRGSPDETDSAAVPSQDDRLREEVLPPSAVRRRRSERHEQNEAATGNPPSHAANRPHKGQKHPAHRRSRRARLGKRFQKALRQVGRVLTDVGIAAAIGVLFAGQWLWQRALMLWDRARVIIEQLWNHIRRKTEPDGDYVHRGRAHHRQRYYCYVPDDHGRHKRVRTACTAALACVLAFSVFRLGAYGMDYMSSRCTSDELREAYYQALAEETESPEPIPATATPTPAATPKPQATPTPTATPRTMLTKVSYPDNPYATISSRFRKIRRQNSDIIGWLTIPELIDEAVVQRDNSYYLRRDYRGYHNNNGAIFLEESCKLDSRPYTMMLFGHNMKSGAMFGCLRNYENIYFYRNNAFITFDTAYEESRYVIFSVGTLSQKKRDRNFVDITSLVSSNIEWREKAIAQLKKISEFSSGIEVTADDQILLLITCVDDDTERRVVAARRIRENESEEGLQKLVNRARSR